MVHRYHRSSTPLSSIIQNREYLTTTFCKSIPKACIVHVCLQLCQLSKHYFSSSSSDSNTTSPERPSLLPAIAPTLRASRRKVYSTTRKWHSVKSVGLTPSRYLSLLRIALTTTSATDTHNFLNLPVKKPVQQVQPTNPSTETSKAIPLSDPKDSLFQSEHGRSPTTTCALCAL